MLSKLQRISKHSEEESGMFEETFRSGEFAALCGVEKKTLFYYDEINLLKPAFRAENGYRYYTLTQFDQMNTIKILQASGLSLEEIAEIMHTSSYNRRYRYLSVQLETLTRKIEDLTAARNHLKKAVSSMEMFLSRKTDCLFEEEQEDSYYLLSPIEKSRVFSFLRDGYEYGLLYDPSSDVPGKEFLPFRYFHAASGQKYDFHRKAGTYLCMFHLLEKNETDHAAVVRNFLGLIRKSGRTPDGPVFYENSYGEFYSSSRYNTLMKLSVSIP